MRMMSHQIENFNKEMETMQRDQIQIQALKSIATEMKKSLKVPNKRFEPAEERISKLENRSFEIMQSEKQKDKTMTSEQSLRD